MDLLEGRGGERATGAGGARPESKRVEQRRGGRAPPRGPTATDRAGAPPAGGAGPSKRGPPAATGAGGRPPKGEREGGVIPASAAASHALQWKRGERRGKGGGRGRCRSRYQQERGRGGGRGRQRR